MTACLVSQCTCLLPPAVPSEEPDWNFRWGGGVGETFAEKWRVITMASGLRNEEWEQRSGWVGVGVRWVRLSLIYFCLNARCGLMWKRSRKGRRDTHTHTHTHTHTETEHYSSLPGLHLLSPRTRTPTHTHTHTRCTTQTEAVVHANLLHTHSITDTHTHTPICHWSGGHYNSPWAMLVR